MTRCDNEGIFYRVFCIGLLIIAFTFTVILTNVFVDIDGLLSKKEQESSVNQGHVTESYDRTPYPQEYYGGARNEDGGNSAFRTKRALDSPDFLLHIKNPKMKNVLTHRLATLLEELDEEEGTVFKRDETNDKLQDSNDIYVKTDNKKTREEKAKEKEVTSEISRKKDSDDMLHMAMHNILLKGVIEHMDLNEVYKKVHTLVRNFKNEERMFKEKKLQSTNDSKNEVKTDESIQPTTPFNEENKFFEELAKCTKLQQEIAEGSTEKSKALENNRNRKPNISSPKFLIKTLIDIQKNDKENDANSNENIKGIIRLIYNGKSIKIRSMDEEETATITKPITMETTTTNMVNRDVEVVADILKDNFGSRNVPKSYVNSILIEYLNKFKRQSNIPEIPIKYTEKRIKRSMKYHHVKEKKQNKKQTEKKDDDELFVEIETHFDDRGLKGKKKKELIKKLIEKIQKAIHSNQELKKPVKNGNELHIRKRIQHSFGHENDIQQNIINKSISQYDSNLFREQYPISKVAPALDPLPKVADENGQDWKKKETGPKFFSISKSINSAELGQVDVDFNKVMTLTGVPQRFQIPLNTDLSEESPNAYLDLGNLQFMIKDIEGSGFSIGLNQYVDHAPDPESIKLFTGIESLVNTYHQTYDLNNPPLDYSRAGITVLKHEMKKRDIKRNDPHIFKPVGVKSSHAIKKRSVDPVNDYHSNEYKIIFDDKFLPYENYQEIYEHKQKKITLPLRITKNDANVKIKENDTTLATDLERLFEQKLKPSEIFDLASFLDRKKRSHSVQKIMNLNTKIRLNRYINTKAMPKQKFFLKKKRNKRQIGKIRIIAKDMKGRSDSDENFFIVSDENMYADRAVLRRTDTSPDSPEDKPEEIVDYEPSIFEDPKPRVYNALEDRIRHNTLMSKYPHVFVEDVSNDEVTQKPTEFVEPVFSKTAKHKTEVEMFTDHEVLGERMPKVQDLVHALVPYPKTNYKVTVKLLPKDENDTRSGFKEIHTSINKTFNKNGLLFSSLVNVSEISKVEAANGTNDEHNGYINALQTIGFPWARDLKTYELNNNKDDNEFSIVVSTTPSTLENKHDELTRMLQQQKETIDNHFKKLKENLHTVAESNATTAPPETRRVMMNLHTATHPPQTFHMGKDYISEMLCKHMNMEKDATTTTTETTTIKPTTTTKPEVIDALKVKLLNAISQNERLTSQILNKIDQNTDILQTFLTKITDKIQSIPVITKQVIDTPVTADNHEHPKLNAHPIFMRQPNNDTDVPFIYAYQPYRRANKVETPVASLVYHEVTPKNPQKNEMVHVVQTNAQTAKPDFDFDTLVQKDNTRYFIDEDYFKTFVTHVNAEIKPNNVGVKKDDKLKIHDKDPDVIAGDDHNHVQSLKSNVKVNIFKFKSNAPKLNTTKIT